ncbi:rab GTPase-activating protein 22 isoform X3 [Nicotiana tabacum]|uniref:Rab GTPase-activating protein 22 isoform X3 n=1 Tax=Nicotiana tabacum TaxID=4097 RepID=A0AC58RSX6_TOBAC
MVTHFEKLEVVKLLPAWLEGGRERGGERENAHVMSFDGAERPWKCGKGGTVNLQKVSSIVRDIGEPCLHQSSIKMSKMLTPTRWQATFDKDGKVHGFRKVLKLIILGGVDPSIRPEVWEFLLGCYALGSSAKYRKKLRTARRERYRDLIKQCQAMHSSVGTGSLAYVVGSKVMDMRTSTKDDRRREADIKCSQASNVNTDNLDSYSDFDNNCIDTSHAHQRESSSDSCDLISARGSTDKAALDSFCSVPTLGPYDRRSTELGGEACQSEFVNDNYFDFPPLPVTDLFEMSSKNKKGPRSYDKRILARRELKFGEDKMHSFRINNNADIVIEANVSSSYGVSRSLNSEIVRVHPSGPDSASWSGEFQEHKTEIFNRLIISDAPDTPNMNARTSPRGGFSDERVSEWLWTLHQIVVDVVRTDSHLEFYEDTKNLARMSDILAVYAWVDPATGYCQGMSDLLSPFVVLFEDNADAFWCFEMLLRRMRENFQMEGPTGVMKQLQALWHIVEFTDRQMFSHLSSIGAESLHFAFRMLLVLFRRELSFNEVLCMWEMMWAADFDESIAFHLGENCPEILVIQIPKESEAESGEEIVENNNNDSKDDSPPKHGSGERTISENNGMKLSLARPFCGLTRNIWSKNNGMPSFNMVSSARSSIDELPVFCVAAILFMNHQKILKETRSIDDLIKIFNDNMLKIRVKRCVRTAIKLRRKYFYKNIYQK